MNPLKNTDIHGTWGTLLLPINDNESIDFGRLASSIDVLIDAGVDGIYSNGTAGEFYNQTEAEFDQITALLADKCTRAGMPFQIGCSHMSPILSLERVKRARAFAPGAIQVILPDWFPPGMLEIIDYLQKIAEAASPIGIVLYNPGHAKKKLTPSDYYTISQSCDAVIGCKTTGGDEKWFAEMKRLVPDLSLFVPGHRLATGVALGAHGSYSNVACIHPRAAQQWNQLMYTDMPAALAMEKRIQHFITQYIFPLITVEGYPDPAIDKFLAALTGWSDVGTRLRWPYRWIPESRVDDIRKACRAELPEFFTNATG